ncbi:MAG: HNH endonuclease [Actinomycetota bacterium]
MRAYVAVTDKDWFDFLRSRPHLDEVNFWQPSAQRPFAAIRAGGLFLFKLKYPTHKIVGGGMLAWSGTFPYPYVWELFEDKNGAASLADMKSRIQRLRRSPLDPGTSDVGCIVLVQPFFLAEDDWIDAPPDWSRNIVQGKTYNLESFYGQRLLEEVETKARRTAMREIEGPMWGDPTLVRRRLGQGAFRTLVTEAYERRCAVTGERALPVLQAGHIRPVTEGGGHRVDNGVLLRSDVHTLFDRGYVTITPDQDFRVSPRLRDDFDNGDAYYSLEGRDLWIPSAAEDRPSREFLEWHNDVVFLR